MSAAVAEVAVTAAMLTVAAAAACRRRWMEAVGATGHHCDRQAETLAQAATPTDRRHARPDRVMASTVVAAADWQRCPSAVVAAVAMTTAVAVAVVADRRGARATRLCLQYPGVPRYHLGVESCPQPQHAHLTWAAVAVAMTTAVAAGGPASRAVVEAAAHRHHHHRRTLAAAAAGRMDVVVGHRAH
jgi:hypothetical protein